MSKQASTKSKPAPKKLVPVGSASLELEPRAESGMDREAGAERPRRVQLSRRKGFTLPPNTVVVSRPSKWGNPYKPGDTVPGVGMVYGRAGAVDFFNRYCFPDLSELRGKNLACWCPLDQPCHADILLRRVGAGEQTVNGTREKTQNVVFSDGRDDAPTKPESL